MQAQTTSSVFKAAGCTNLRFVIHPRHKARDGSNSNTDTVNDGGIYLNNTEAAKTATTLTAKEREKSKQRQELKELPEFGRRSWHYVSVPAEVKNNPSKAAFRFSSPKAASASKSADRDASSAAPG